eukprot:gnl/MRDRNA2_/MRDRNA2_67049_c0_seq1.p1 gnl/MRDRNA2_/MRDRNA2_67049_c0~~gnl/MRDRNA2_/MRDRNA2_67049_c0_seq1.p1  ORF type:complete len:114 (+),score=21.46 gnl/MRDRNA2_/MRDRNA2_67049_c0_seq1:35-376(+)
MLTSDSSSPGAAGGCRKGYPARWFYVLDVQQDGPGNRPANPGRLAREVTFDVALKGRLARERLVGDAQMYGRSQKRWWCWPFSRAEQQQSIPLVEADRFVTTSSGHSVQSSSA